jgi:hypothetical protein
LAEPAERPWQRATVAVKTLLLFVQSAAARSGWQHRRSFPPRPGISPDGVTELDTLTESLADLDAGAGAVTLAAAAGHQHHAARARRQQRAYLCIIAGVIQDH